MADTCRDQRRVRSAKPRYRGLTVLDLFITSALHPMQQSLYQALRRCAVQSIHLWNLQMTVVQSTIRSTSARTRDHVSTTREN